MNSMINNNNSIISNSNKNSTIKPPQNKANSMLNPKASGIKTTSVSIVGGGIPKP